MAWYQCCRSRGSFSKPVPILTEWIFRQSLNRQWLFDVQETFTALEKDREVYLRELEQKRSQEATLRAKRRSIITEQRNRTLQCTSEIEARLATLDEQHRTSARRKAAASLTAPMRGIVDQLEIFTIGAVARAGEQLLRVISEDQNVMIEGLFSNADIGFIDVGQ